MSIGFSYPIFLVSLTRLKFMFFFIEKDYRVDLAKGPFNPCLIYK